MHYWATFRSDENWDEVTPRGRALAIRIRDGLRADGVEAGEVDDWRDSGYSVDCGLGGASVYFFLSFFGRPNQEWALCCTSDLGLISRLMGRSDAAQRLALAKAIAKVLSRDPTIHDLRWYRRWRGGEDDEWTEQPM